MEVLKDISQLTKGCVVTLKMTNFTSTSTLWYTLIVKPIIFL